jgi:uncharacterized Zn-binding protein involved in type VI secretion
MPDAACVGDPTNHPGVIAGPGVLTVLIHGRPAAVQSDTHTCAMPPNAGPHPPSKFTKASTSVRIGGQPALRKGDVSGCGAAITVGASDVQIGG